jgi:DNA-directed RNA polymerase sigma subunit (sigma70/sigma32)
MMSSSFAVRLCAKRSALWTIERYVLEMRRLAGEPLPLEVLAAKFRVSGERVRQIEVRAVERVFKAVRRRADG